MNATTTASLFELSSKDKANIVHLFGYLWLFYSGLVLRYQAANPFAWKAMGKGFFLCCLLYILLYISYKLLKKSIHHAFTATLLTLCSFIALSFVCIALIYFSISPLYLLLVAAALYGYLKSSMHLFAFRGA